MASYIMTAYIMTPYIIASYILVSYIMTSYIIKMTVAQAPGETSLQFYSQLVKLSNLKWP